MTRGFHIFSQGNSHDESRRYNPCYHESTTGTKKKTSCPRDRTNFDAAPSFGAVGLGIVPNPASDNLTPQETTNQADLEVGEDGAGLYCPGSSVVAEKDGEGAQMVKFTRRF